MSVDKAKLEELVPLLKSKGKKRQKAIEELYYLYQPYMEYQAKKAADKYNFTAFDKDDFLAEFHLLFMKFVSKKFRESKDFHALFLISMQYEVRKYMMSKHIGKIIKKLVYDEHAEVDEENLF